MKYILFTLPLIALFLGACNEKTEKEVGPRTPKTLTLIKPLLEGKQLLPDTVVTMGNLSWHTNIKETFALAQKSDRNVVVMVGEDTCRWCKKMKKNTLMDTRVQQEMQKYMLVSIKRSDKEAIKYVPEFDGNIPSFFFMTNKQELLDSIVGYFNDDDFLEYIKEIEE